MHWVNRPFAAVAKKVDPIPEVIHEEALDCGSQTLRKPYACRASSNKQYYAFAQSYDEEALVSLNGVFNILGLTEASSEYVVR